MQVDTTAAPAATPTPTATPVAADAQVAPDPETPPAEAPKADEDDKLGVSRRFAALAKRERALQERERAAKAALNDPDYVAYRRAKEGARDNPMAFLEAQGWTMDSLAQFVLNDRKLTPEQQIAKLQERLDAAEKKKLEEAAASAEAERQSVLDQHKLAITATIDQGGEAFELCRAYGPEAVDLVQQVVESHWEATQVILPTKDAVAAVETWLEAQAREKVLKTKKFAPKESVPSVAGNETARPALSPTLTHRATTGAPSVPEDTSHLSREESIARAARRIVWNP